MAADILEDDDQWLYGDQVSDTKPNADPDPPINENGRPATPTLDDMDADSALFGGPALQARPAGIVSTAPDLQPKPPASSSTSDDANKEEEEDGEGGEGSEEESESDDDDVQITIGAIQTEPVLPPYNRSQSYTRMTIPPGGASAQLKKVDLDAVPTLAGQSLYDVDLDATDRPWRMPGADITDYFNYGFTEDTWKLYCDKQRKMKGEVAIHNKIVVHSSRMPGMVGSLHGMQHPGGLPHMPGSFVLPPPMHPLPPPAVMSSVPPASMGHTDHLISAADDGSKTLDKTKAGGEDNASDGRATPGVDALDSAVSTSKQPLLQAPPASSMPPSSLPPPSGLPPPFHFPPGVRHPGAPDMAAMAAAMMGGMRPPDGSMPPHHMHPGLPHFPPRFPGGMPDGLPHPPFPGMPPPFGFPGGDHGPIPLDERGMPIPPELLGGHGLLPWDPSMGPPPPEMFDFLASQGSRNERRNSRSRSRSSSYSRSRSRSSSVEDKRGRRKERRHRRHSKSRSRSRDRERDRHRSTRHHRDHHRDRHDRDRDRDRDRERDRERRRRDKDRERDKDRDDRSRRERRKQHRSGSQDREEERSSRKEKNKEGDAKEPASKSRTPS